MSSKLDKLMSKLLKFTPKQKLQDIISEQDIKSICVMATTLLTEELNVQRVDTPVIVCGDIHGQYFDLLNIFSTYGHCPDINYLFLGDYVDRGYYSLETILLLLILKIRYPDRITLLRGNHESRIITQTYGFYEECIQKYESANVWQYITDTFDYLTISAIIDGNNKKIFGVHGGISPETLSLDNIQLTVDRKHEIPQSGIVSDLLWSDPAEEIDLQQDDPKIKQLIEEQGYYTPSPRGCGCYFGQKLVQEFNYQNNVSLIIRSHQLVRAGYREMFDKQLIIVWSAPNYCKNKDYNQAFVVQIDDNLETNALQFVEAQYSKENQPSRKMPDYFL